MKKITSLCTLFTAVMIMFTPDAAQSGTASDVRLMDYSSILKNCGFPDGVYKNRIENDILDEINFSDESGIRSVDGNSDTIDTQEEFLTAAFYNVKLLPAKAQKVINSELPSGKTGALRLASMWMRKKAENTDSKDGCDKAVKLIMDKSGVTNAEIRRYFAAAMEKEISKAGKKYDITASSLKPVVEYYVDPSNSAVKKIAQAAIDSKNKGAYTLVVRDINLSLANKVTAALRTDYETN